jgi:hypothetical protein
MRNRSRDGQFGYRAYAIINTLVTIQRSNEWADEEPADGLIEPEYERGESEHILVAKPHQASLTSFHPKSRRDTEATDWI